MQADEEIRRNQKKSEGAETQSNRMQAYKFNEWCIRLLLLWFWCSTDWQLM